MEKKINTWNIIFWICVIIVTIWFIAKALGYINTPDLVKIIPIIGTFIALFAFVKRIGVYLYKIDKIEIKVDNIEKEIHILDKKTTVLETNFQNIDKRLGVIGSKI